MISGRLKSVMHRLSHGTVVAALLASVKRAPARVRATPASGRTCFVAGFPASVHDRRRTPRAGGGNTPKGHAALPFKPASPAPDGCRLGPMVLHAP
jgi:hypothetical protein